MIHETIFPKSYLEIEGFLWIPLCIFVNLKYRIITIKRNNLAYHKFVPRKICPISQVLFKLNF
jgi:hypothetical protein